MKKRASFFIDEVIFVVEQAGKLNFKPLFFHSVNMLRSTSSLKSTPEYITDGMFVRSIVVHGYCGVVHCSLCCR